MVWSADLCQPMRTALDTGLSLSCTSMLLALLGSSLQLLLPRQPQQTYMHLPCRLINLSHRCLNVFGSCGETTLWCWGHDTALLLCGA